MDTTPQQTTPRSIELSPPVTLSGILPDLKVAAGVRPDASALKALPKLLIALLFARGFHLMLFFRLGAAFNKCKLYPLSLICERVIYHWYHCEISTHAQIGPALWIAHPLGIVISKRARIGREVHLRQNVEIVHVWPQDAGRAGLVGDRVQLMSGCILLRGAIVGEDSVVAARAVVSKIVPPRHLAIGMPAVIKPLRPDQFTRSSTPNRPEGAPRSLKDFPPINSFPPREE